MSIAERVIDRETPAHRPPGRPAGYHCWHHLTFLHWRVEPEQIAPLLPRRLTLDTFDGSAWIGLVPFTISGLRPWWAPAVPGLSAFDEINVRTYVHYQGRNPGVWFFSLDANHALAVAIARWRWHLNYYRAALSIAWERAAARRGEGQREYAPQRAALETAGAMPGAIPGDVLRYTAHRRGQDAMARVDVRIEPSANADGSCETQPRRAAPGSLDHFLLDRYFLYAQRNRGPLWTAQVHHAPYLFHDADVLRCDESLVAAAGIATEGPPCHAVYCPGVAVEIFPLQKLT